MINCAIVGATGIVGRTFLKVLEEKNLNIDSYTLFASEKSAGKKINFLDKELTIKKLDEDSFLNEHFDFALFSAGTDVSKKYAPIVAKTGCIVIDNSSYFRMNKDIPLVVPEVNAKDIFSNSNIISNPNCSTIQAVIALNPIHKKYGIKRIVYSTYQAVSGAGQKGIEDLINDRNNSDVEKFPYSIKNNCIPQIDVFLENDYSKEEVKMIEETKKILHDPNLKITATCVRVPVINCHGESINVELENEFNISDVKQLLSVSDGIVVLDDLNRQIYPLNTFADGKDDVFIGRLRRDFSVKNGLNFWCVSDNLRKGAATNAIQILENLLKKRLAV